MTLVGMKAFIPLRLLEWPWWRPGKGKSWDAQLQPGKNRNVGSPLSLCWQCSEWGYSFCLLVCVELGWSRMIVVYKFSILLGCPFLRPLAGESRLFMGFFCLCLLALGVTGFSSIQSGIYTEKRKPTKLTAVSFLEFQVSQLVCLLVFTIQCVLIFVLHLTCRVFNLLSKRKREIYIYSIFLEAEVLCQVLIQFIPHPSLTWHQEK